MKYLAYPKYKGSSIEWIGEIPEQWTTDRIKASVKSCNNGIWGSEPTGDANDIICVRVADFDRDSLAVDISNPTLRNITERERSSRILKRGDLLIEKSGGGENQPVGCVTLYELDSPAVCSNFIAKMTLKEGMIPAFWKYVHAAAYSIRLTVGSINQTSGIQNLDQERYFNERAPFPSTNEQKKIAAFLDKETEKIDALIQKQELLVSLIDERRNSLVTETLTAGISQKKLKDSGNKFIGLIPEHWGIGPLKHFLQPTKGALKTGPFGSDLTAKDMLETGDIKIYNQRNVIDKDFLEGENYISLSKFEELRAFEIFSDDILITTRGTIGKAVIVPEGAEKGILHPCLIRMQIEKSMLLPEYLLQALNQSNILISQLNYLSNSTTIEVIYSNTLANVVMPIPPISEQKAILHYLDEKLLAFDELKAKATKSIQLLREHRSSTIYAGVTGKIDLREAA